MPTAEPDRSRTVRVGVVAGAVVGAVPPLLLGGAYGWLILLGAVLGGVVAAVAVR